jgi:hypothetical protein
MLNPWDRQRKMKFLYPTLTTPGDASMRRLARQREAVLALGLLLSVLGSFGAAAAQTKLVTKCQPPEAANSAGGSSQPKVICDVRANGFAIFNDVKATLKDGGKALEAKFDAFDPAVKGATTAYLIQLLPNNRRATLSQMGDAVVTFTDRRDGKRRFTAYSFANDLTLISDSGASKNEFVRQMIAVKPASGTIQLYKNTLRALDDLSKEPGDRKNLVVLADGTSDDTGYSHDQVVKAARDAGITIHVLGYYDDRTDRPKFQTLSRLAEDTGGYAAEIKQGGKDLTKDIVTSRFVGEVLENGGLLNATLTGTPGPQTVEISADLADGTNLKTEEKVEIPAAPQQIFETPPERTSGTEPPENVSSGPLDWFADNAMLVSLLVVLLGLGAAGYAIYRPGAVEHAAAEHATDSRTTEDNNTKPPEDEGEGELLRGADGKPAVYGWLEMLDGNALRHPLRTTNVRVGRHRDNDICLLNDSISRRHAVLHYNADTRRFVITDLGGGNGVVVNKTKYKTRELNDGDTVELGEVRLRFRAETEFLT